MNSAPTPDLLAYVTTRSAAPFRLRHALAQSVKSYDGGHQWAWGCHPELDGSLLACCEPDGTITVSRTVRGLQVRVPLEHPWVTEAHWTPDRSRAEALLVTELKGGSK